MARWRWDLRMAMCRHGLHWPIRWTRDTTSGFEPPEPGWACEWCGHVRLPYRAPLWYVIDFIRHPILTLKDR